jgi:hemerythrin
MWNHVFMASIEQVKDHCSIAIDMLVNELNTHFRDCKLMNDLGIMYTQLEMHLNVDSFYSFHLGVINKDYYESKNVKPSFLQISKPLNSNILNLHMCMFKLITWICKQQGHGKTIWHQCNDQIVNCNQQKWLVDSKTKC